MSLNLLTTRNLVRRSISCYTKPEVIEKQCVVRRREQNIKLYSVMHSIAIFQGLCICLLDGNSQQLASTSSNVASQDNSWSSSLPFLVSSRNAPPQKQLVTFEQHSFSIVVFEITDIVSYVTNQSTGHCNQHRFSCVFKFCI